MPEFDCDYQDHIICPYCGYANPDSWECLLPDKRDGDVLDEECPDCGKNIKVTIHIDISYSTVTP